jgi:hypothetical protein
MYFEYNYFQVLADAAHQIQSAASVRKSTQTKPIHPSCMDRYPFIYQGVIFHFKIISVSRRVQKVTQCEKLRTC